MSPEAAAGAFALGVRQQEDLIGKMRGCCCCYAFFQSGDYSTFM